MFKLTYFENHIQYWTNENWPLDVEIQIAKALKPQSKLNIFWQVAWNLVNSK